tara:strand:+ start:1587 stop:2150 length:564 start_codon:yes stop_codon:yes gene_type:complete
MVSKSPRRPQNPQNAVRKPNLPSPGLLQTPEQVIHYYDRLGFDVDSSIPVEKIIENNPDLDLKYADLGINDAYIKKIPDSRFEIGVNEKHHINRQRFSMAHEYGHYLLHREKIQEMPVGEQILHRNGARNRTEYQANVFAAELLMPENLVKKSFRNCGGNLKQMADYLRVSKESLKYRLEALGYRVV